MKGVWSSRTKCSLQREQMNERKELFLHIPSISLKASEHVTISPSNSVLCPAFASKTQNNWIIWFYWSTGCNILNTMVELLYITHHIFTKKIQKIMFEEKNWFAIKITIVICICWYWHSWFNTNFSQNTCAFFQRLFFPDVLESWKL